MAILQYVCVMKKIFNYMLNPIFFYMKLEISLRNQIKCTPQMEKHLRDFEQIRIQPFSAYLLWKSTISNCKQIA